MTCKTCGHSESLHNRILNSDLCPFDYIDGECIADGNKIVPCNQSRWEQLAAYGVIRMRRLYRTAGSGFKAERQTNDPARYSMVVDNLVTNLIHPHICGCLKFIPAEEPCKK